MILKSYRRRAAGDKFIYTSFHNVNDRFYFILVRIQEEETWTHMSPQIMLVKNHKTSTVEIFPFYYRLQYAITINLLTFWFSEIPLLRLKLIFILIGSELPDMVIKIWSVVKRLILITPSIPPLLLSPPLEFRRTIKSIYQYK